MTWARSSLAAALLLCWLPVTTQASERSTSYSLWAVTGNTVLMRYTLPQDQLRHLVPQGWPTPATAQVSAYLLRNITVQSAGGECPALDQGYDIGKVDPLPRAVQLRAHVPLQRPTRHDALQYRAA
jgi:hypothetical protein